LVINNSKLYKLTKYDLSLDVQKSPELSDVKYNICWRINFNGTNGKAWQGPSMMSIGRNYPCMVAVKDKVLEINIVKTYLKECKG